MRQLARSSLGVGEQFVTSIAMFVCMVLLWACTKTRNNETKRAKRNHRNHRNERNETTATSETTEIVPDWATACFSGDKSLLLFLF